MPGNSKQRRITILEGDSIQTEQDCSSAVCQAVKDRPSHRDTDPEELNCDLDELIAQKHFENTSAQEFNC